LGKSSIDAMANTVHPCTQYALDVVEGRRVVGTSERMACERHLRDLERQGTDVFPWVFDESRANRVYEFIGYCHHFEGELAGQPIVLEAFQKFDIGSIFGWVHKDTGARRFKKGLILMARKNGKTALLAAVDLYLMVGDNEMSPAVYCAAVDRGQARLMYDASKTMAENSPDIARRLIIRDYKMTHATRGGIMMPLSKSTKNKDGLHPSGAVVDEYHAHETSEIYDLLSSAKGGHRLQPLIMIISTAGMDVESPCHAEYEYCWMILKDNTLNERYFVMIRELGPDDDEHDPKNWIKANPLRMLLPRSVEELQEQHDEAFGSADAAKIRTFRVKNLNRWVQGNEHTFMADYMDKWETLKVSPEEFLKLTTGRSCLVGSDLSRKIDLTGVGYIFILSDGRIGVKAHGFIPEESIKKHEKTDRVPYRDWTLADRWMTATPGDVTDYRAVMKYIDDSRTKYDWKVHQVCYDPYNATQFATEISDMGYMTVEIRQTMQVLSEPTKLFRDLVAAGKIVHDGSPALTWCVGNAREIVDSKDNVMISKKNASATKRIDLLAALITALRQIQALKSVQSLRDDLDSGDFGF